MGPKADSESPIRRSLRSLIAAAAYKRKLPYYQRALQGWLGGAYLAFGNFVSAALAGGYLTTSPATAKLVYAVLFPIGLMLIIFSQVDLFTSNCMTVTLGVYYDSKCSWCHTKLQLSSGAAILRAISR